MKIDIDFKKIITEEIYNNKIEEWKNIWSNKLITNDCTPIQTSCPACEINDGIEKYFKNIMYTDKLCPFCPIDFSYQVKEHLEKTCFSKHSRWTAIKKEKLWEYKKYKILDLIYNTVWFPYEEFIDNAYKTIKHAKNKKE